MIRIPIDTIWKFIKICGKKGCKTYKIPDFFAMRNKLRKK